MGSLGDRAPPSTALTPTACHPADTPPDFAGALRRPPSLYRAVRSWLTFVVISFVEQWGVDRTEMMRESPRDNCFGVSSARLQKSTTT